LYGETYKRELNKTEEAIIPLMVVAEISFIEE
jgi:hypothetical protein